jgi:acetamidase/formamidase
MAETLSLAASPETVRWGMFDATIPPVLTVHSGDTVVIETVSGKGEALPPKSSGLYSPPALYAINEAGLPMLGPHILTGPVAIAGAMPGDMLEVRIDAIEFGADWGYCGMRTLGGTLPEDFPFNQVDIIPIDRTRRVCKLPWGTELPLAPFFGVIGVAPKPAYGRLSTVQPREHAGNLDNKELVAGATLYLPVWAEGGLFSCGDGHGVQGDGEVCINALETSLTGTFTFILHKGAGLTFPRAETPTHYISMGMDADLDIAMKMALREMIKFICSRTNLAPEQAYRFCSLAVDFHVTQSVNGEKGIHGMLKKGLLF